MRILRLRAKTLSCVVGAGSSTTLARWHSKQPGWRATYTLLTVPFRPVNPLPGAHGTFQVTRKCTVRPGAKDVMPYRLGDSPINKERLPGDCMDRSFLEA